ncbi:importin-13 isoform X2 [Pseudomyrmex gracilis]|uniref:importin-13 isoform X2 n=1 Tax=Pseudomyrmex gracilis TaxID=219809 RepID=UPI000994B9BE|nr:importin-13 isoform X2 [Pseudomyrmex gracilis]
MDYATVIDDAIKQFYSAGNNEAHSWLLQVQTSPEAWHFVWQLLEPSKGFEVQFFAATTLHTKISKHWNEVPENEYPVLKERLLNSVKRPNTPIFILTKLCQALAAFVVNIYNTENKEKNRSIVDKLLDILPYNSPSALELLLRVLSTLPDEYKKTQAKCAKLREAVVHNVLNNSWCQTAWFLQQVFSMCNPNSQGNDSILYSLGLECAQLWLQSGQLPLEASGQIYPYLLVAAAHYAPNREGGDDENNRSWEIIQDCLMMIVTHNELNKRPQTLWEWARNLVAMAQQHREKYFCEILTAIGEAHSRAFLIALAENSNDMHTWTAMGLIELLLECSEQEGRYPVNETRSCIPFGFWYALQDDLATLDQPLDSRALEALKPIYFRLSQALLRKSTLPASPSEQGNADDREHFRCYRQDAADTLDYCYRVLGSDLLELLGQRLSLKDLPWTHVESTLHAFKALAESVGTREYCYTPALINLILLHIPYHAYPEEVLTCACSTLGAYAEWIGEHPEPWLEKVLELVTQGLTRGSMTAPFASMALKDLARECGPHLAPYAPSVLHTISQILPNVEPGGGEGLRLIYAAGKLLNVLPTLEEQLMHLEATLGLCVTKIKELLGQPLFTARVGVTNYLKMVTTFFTTIEGAIGKAVLDGVLPIFNQIVVHPEWSQDNATLEAMHTCAQRSLSALRQPETEARPLLPILLTSYKIWPHPTALHLLKQLVLLFGKDPDNIVGPVLAEMSSITLNGVKACRSVNGDLSEWSDLMEAYLSVLAQICKKNASMLLQIPDQIPDMLQCGVACLTLPEIATAKAAGHFLSHAIIQSPHLQTFVQPIGQELVSAILHCVGGGVSCNSLEPHAEVLLALNKMCPEWTAQWIRAGLENQKILAAVMLEKDNTIRVLRERKSRIILCEILKQFSIECRQKTGL